jgi:hypothetical protein
MLELNKLIEQYNNNEITFEEYQQGLDHIGWLK